MKIVKVIEHKYGIDNQDTYHDVHIEHNGMKAFYVLEHSLMPLFSEELEKFRKCFFNYNGDVDWRDCIDDPLEFFTECSILQNEEYNKKASELENEYMNQCQDISSEDFTFEDYNV